MFNPESSVREGIAERKHRQLDKIPPLVRIGGLFQGVIPGAFCVSPIDNRHHFILWFGLLVWITPGFCGGQMGTTRNTRSTKSPFGVGLVGNSVHSCLSHLSEAGAHVILCPRSLSLPSWELSSRPFLQDHSCQKTGGGILRRRDTHGENPLI